MTKYKKRLVGRPTNLVDPTALHLDMVNEADHKLTATGLLKLSISLVTNSGSRTYQGIVNCGATANFVLINLMEGLSYTLMYRDSARVVGANGEEMALAGRVKLFTLLFAVHGNTPSPHGFWGMNISHNFILGLPWLWATNPKINWLTSEIEVTNNIEVSDPEDFLVKLEAKADMYAYLTEEPLTVLPKQYKDFQDMFNEHSDATLPSHREGLDHTIKLLPGVKPTFRPLYNLSQRELDILKSYIEKNLKSGFI